MIVLTREALEDLADDTYRQSVALYGAVLADPFTQARALTGLTDQEIAAALADRR